MAYVRSRKFCCCLPVRFGVICESLLGLLLGGFASVAAWLELSQMMKGTLALTHSEQISLWCVAVIMTIFTLVSLMGLIGGFGRIRPLVGLYAGTITFVTVLDIAAGIFLFYNLFANGDEKIQQCESGVQGGNSDVTRWECNTSFKTARVVVVVVYVLWWLVQIYGCVIAIQYVKQLEEEESEQARDSERGQGQTQNITIVTKPEYAFAAPPNSYGQ